MASIIAPPGYYLKRFGPINYDDEPKPKRLYHGRPLLTAEERAANIKEAQRAYDKKKNEKRKGPKMKKLRYQTGAHDSAQRTRDELGQFLLSMKVGETVRLSKMPFPKRQLASMEYHAQAFIGTLIQNLPTPKGDFDESTAHVYQRICWNPSLDGPLPC